MKETKEQRGITLIALIITIVVLLILAGVAIASIQDGGILGYANGAASSWNQATENEAGILDGYLGYLNPCLEGHTYGEWITVTEAGDCQTKVNGSRERTCSVCGYKQTETLYWQHSYAEAYWESDIPCDLCQKSCEHTETFSSEWFYWGDNYFGPGIPTHTYDLNCKYCKWFFNAYVTEVCQLENGKCTTCGNEYVCEHKGGYEDGKCIVCGYECEHSNIQYGWYSNNEHSITCSVCSKSFGNGSHNMQEIGYSISGSDGHFRVFICNVCGMDYLNTEVLPHTMQDGTCTACYWSE